MNDSAAPEEPTRTEPRILVVDLETSSLDARRGSILEIGAAWLLGGGEGEFHMECRAWEGAELDPESLRVNGCSLARCANPSLPTEAEALAEFRIWVGDEPFILAGLNPSHDRAFLHEALRRSVGRFVKWIPHRCLDLHTLAVAYAVAQGLPIPSRGYYTDEIYAILDLPEEPKPHSAIVGARKEAEALRMLLSLPEIAEPIPYELVGTPSPISHSSSANE